MKDLTKCLVAFGVTHTSGWGPRDPHFARFERLHHVTANRFHWFLLLLKHDAFIRLSTEIVKLMELDRFIATWAPPSQKRAPQDTHQPNSNSKKRMERPTAKTICTN
ncbi:hypothetical protein T265_11106 [Opisthorchis viverrini]|uniref:Uncharacterized protein n=1 Tax=Opisthorchis viverrini TaxID=6198 RepID=A0A074ZYR5_OPIVI|nr:hypothetical protein T265_11106 [Opisthorchis viverrini]KER20324.1 hypothetical protein T265_11106 [Opisthorchis viverrini]